jgi:hypothetical protein
MTTYIYHTDPGHGWIEVPVADLQELGLKLADFTRYSYMKHDRVYLEEDCDAAVFVNAYREKRGECPAFRVQNTNSDSIIRTFKRLPV